MELLPSLCVCLLHPHSVSETAEGSKQEGSFCHLPPPIICRSFLEVSCLGFRIQDALFVSSFAWLLALTRGFIHTRKFAKTLIRPQTSAHGEVLVEVPLRNLCCSPAPPPFWPHLLELNNLHFKTFFGCSALLSCWGAPF